MPSTFVSLVLVVLCAAYMHFSHAEDGCHASSGPLTSESHRIQSIIDKKVREAGGLEKVRSLILVSAIVEPGKYQFRTRNQRVLLLLMRCLRLCVCMEII